MLLMNHFSTTTAPDLFPSREAARIWQHVLPEEASRNPLIMHGILALAGLHMAHSQGSLSLSSPPKTRALHHQQKGLAIFQVRAS